jgi:hypothetical protein
MSVRSDDGGRGEVSLKSRKAVMDNHKESGNVVMGGLEDTRKREWDRVIMKDENVDEFLRSTNQWS